MLKFIIISVKQYRSTNMRQFTGIDRCIEQFDGLLRTLTHTVTAQRPYPAATLSNSATLSAKEQQQSAGLMRVNHAGEICAQALYQGQALTAQTTTLKTTLQQSAHEENDHLAWCQQRLRELNSHTSYLGPIWFFGALTLGMIAGLCGDRYNLGFLAETEQQVVTHLGRHLIELPAHDQASRAIVEQMQADEAHHATVAQEAGAAELPEVIKQLMRLTAKIMTTTAYYL